MKEIKMCCTTCPNSCALMVTVEGDQVLKVEGNTCKRGIPFAEKELVAPERMLTSTVIVTVDGVEKQVPVKSATPMLRSKMMDAMSIIRGTRINHGVNLGDVILANVADCGVDIVAAKTVR
ncbi:MULTISPECIES: DUF1667 domain-containing protein [Eubacterium]|uniref:CxxC motif-containing protein n=1 Tax=Eubacterium barkeri TaxID=1528 RepID=A0A1H3GV75_EUBBA|nr:DUF1667 domain-containing protein [Eubacterium barkeri]SDY06950.1 CxxC motif-containing protein [Eubacterium barkeri]